MNSFIKKIGGIFFLFAKRILRFTIRFVLTIAGYFLFAQSLYFFKWPFEKKGPAKIKPAYTITNDFKKCAKKKYGLKTYGVIGSYYGTVSNIDISFSSDEDPSTRKLRTLVIELSQDLLNRINKNTEVRPYLSNYPFTIQNIKLSFTIENSSSKRGCLSHQVKCSAGKLQYHTNIDEGPTIQLFEEKYDEALAIYNRTHPDSLQTTSSHTD